MKKTKTIMFSVSLLVPAVLSALGFGSVEVNSFLNEPFEARIPVIGSNNISPKEVKVFVASPEAYENTGLDRQEDLSKLSFSVKRFTNNKMIIFVTSKDPIGTPFLDMLLDINWPGGHLFRGYSVLLDTHDYPMQPVKKPKVLSTEVEANEDLASSDATSSLQSATPQNQAAAASIISLKPIPIANFSPLPEPIEKPAPRVVMAPKVERILIATVKDDTTLWHIANEMKSKLKGNYSQILIALVRENPQAFIGGNMNYLAPGAKLYLPSQKLVNSVSRKQALDWVLQHHQAWKTHSKLALIYPDKPITLAEQRTPPVAPLPTQPEAVLEMAPAATADLPKPAVGSISLMQTQTEKRLTEELRLTRETAEKNFQMNLTLKKEIEMLKKQYQLLLSMMKNREQIDLAAKNLTVKTTKSS